MKPPYQVEWLPEALQALADIWLQAADRTAVKAAQDYIDDRLSRDPLGAGPHLNEGLYQIVSPPLMAFFAVDEADKTVEVYQVWYRP